MSPRRALSLGFELLAILLVVSLVAGQILNYPVLLGYVETGSMEPTLHPGDGFVAVPAPVAGDVEEGDVVVFRAEEIQGGGLTTHRIVGETERGYITRGDANPFTDQDGDEPPVKDAQIVGKALQIGGQVVVVPNLGTAVMGIQDAMQATQRWLAATVGSRSLLGTQGLTYIVLALSALLYVFDLFASSSNTKARERSRSRDSGVSTQLVLVGLAVALVLSATAAMVVPAGTQKYGVVSAEFDSDRPTIIPTGESKSHTYPVANAGLVPVVVYLEPGSQGVAIDPRRVHVGSRGTVNATLTLSAPAETGYYRRYLVTRRYLAVLPTPVIHAAYTVHPWLPIALIDALLGGAFYLLGRVALGTGRVRMRNRSRDTSNGVWRLVRRLY